jgi:hypothetical protein
MNAVRTSFYIARDIQARLRLAARTLKRSQTDLVNEALDAFLTRHQPTKLRSIGVGADEAMAALEAKRWARTRLAGKVSSVREKGRR